MLLVLKFLLYTEELLYLFIVRIVIRIIVIFVKIVNMFFVVIDMSFNSTVYFFKDKIEGISLSMNKPTMNSIFLVKSRV